MIGMPHHTRELPIRLRIYASRRVRVSGNRSLNVPLEMRCVAISLPRSTASEPNKSVRAPANDVESSSGAATFLMLAKTAGPVRNNAPTQETPPEPEPEAEPEHSEISPGKPLRDAPMSE